MDCRVNRCGFLKTATWGATGWWVLEHSRSAWSYQANEKMNVALVGVGCKFVFAEIDNEYPED